MRLLFSALICAHALALPAARGNALRPGDLERTDGPKCCHCGLKVLKSRWPTRPYSEWGCWKDAGFSWQDAKNPLKKESCRDTCAEHGGNHGVHGYTKRHFSCATLAGKDRSWNPRTNQNEAGIDESLLVLYSAGGGKMCAERGEQRETE
jgi:hypothetical protein